MEIFINRYKMTNFKDIDRWKIFGWLENNFWKPLNNKPWAATSEEWDSWGKFSKANYPIRYWFFEEFPIQWCHKFNWTNDLYWWFQYRFNPGHQYNKITFAKPGYYDCDRQVLFAVCELVSQFVEFQLSKGHVDWEEAEDHKNAFAIMREVRDYWREEYPNRENDYPEYPEFAQSSGLFTLLKDRSEWTEQQKVDYDYWCNRHSFIEERHITREQEILTKAISVRRYMWD